MVTVVTHSHEGLEHAGDGEEPHHAAGLGHGAVWLEPQQQIRQDA